MGALFFFLFEDKIHQMNQGNVHFVVENAASTYDLSLNKFMRTTSRASELSNLKNDKNTRKEL